MNWRKWNHVIHRDLGFLCIGLTLIYALSGIAVNHIADWNPNYTIEQVDTQIDPLPIGVINPVVIPQILQKLGEVKGYENAFQPDPENLWIYVEKRMIRINLPTGKVEQERVKRRPFWYRLNFLHLNHPKKAWTWIADFYAGSLFLLACSGLLMVSRKNGLQRRGLILTGTGILLPLIFLLIYY